jgi:alkylation response protein AidB-like acyl-CoA dehydrogenase
MYQLNEEEHMILAMVDSVCADVVSERAAQIDEDDEFPQDMYDLVAEQGIFGLSMPEDFGGFAVSVNCWAQCVARLAQESPAVALLLFVNAVRYGNDEQKAAYLPDLISGEKKISFALTEPNAGSDVWSLGTTAKPKGDGYVINGNKLFISNAEVADYFCLFAQVDVDGERKPTCFIVDASNPGLQVSAHEKKLGLHGSPTCPLFFENMEVPASAIVGEVGQGAEIAYHALNRARIAIAACALGITKASLKASAEYAQGRRQFGQLICDFQTINFMLADMEIRVQASELMLDQAIEAYVSDARDVKKKVAAAKIYCTEAAQLSSTDAVQIHGGYGFCKEYPVERYYRDAKAFTIIAGTNQVQRRIIADEVKKTFAL